MAIKTLEDDALKMVWQLHPDDASGYMLMSSIHAEAYDMDNAGTVQESRKNAHAEKKAGKAWIEVKDKLHEFTVGGDRYQQSDEDFVKLKRLSNESKEVGHVPLLDLVMEQPTNRDKETSFICVAS